MVKVTFNSALAQKEAKKDEPKSSEEALIIPPDAVAVDCKVRGRRAGRAGPVSGTGRGAEGAGLPLFPELRPSLVWPQLLCSKVRVQGAVPAAGVGAREARGGKAGRTAPSSRSTVRSGGRDWAPPARRPAATSKATKTTAEFGASSQCK